MATFLSFYRYFLTIVSCENIDTRVLTAVQGDPFSNFTRYVSISQTLLKIIKIWKRNHKLKKVQNVSCKYEYNRHTNKKTIQ